MNDCHSAFKPFYYKQYTYHLVTNSGMTLHLFWFNEDLFIFVLYLKKKRVNWFNAARTSSCICPFSIQIFLPIVGQRTIQGRKLLCQLNHLLCLSSAFITNYLPWIHLNARTELKRCQIRQCKMLPTHTSYVTQ